MPFVFAWAKLGLEVRAMKRLLVVGLLLSVLLVPSAQAGAGKPPPNKVKDATWRIWTLAMDWPRVAYASGKEGSSETIRIWNVVTGKTSVIKSGNHGFAVHHTAEIAITGTRLVWIRSQQFGNTELDHRLYTASVGGKAHLLKRMLGYTGANCGLGGPQLGGLVGSGGASAVSTWDGGHDGSVSSNERLNLVTPTRLRTIAVGPGAILSESADGGHIAVLPLPTPTVIPDGCYTTPPTSVAVYSTKGVLLQTIALPPRDASTLGYHVAISGNRLVVLTYGLYEPSGPSWVTLTVYDWPTGDLLHTWPVGITQYTGEVRFSVYRSVAAVEGPFRLHLVDLDAGKDVVIAPASQTVCPPALDGHGLVYAVNPHNRGKLVFVPTARVKRLLGR
jgi:hypothetical protein